MNPSQAQPDVPILAQVQAAVAAVAAAAAGHADVVDYDWRRPYRFTRLQRQHLADFARSAAEAVASTLATVLREDVPLRPEDPAEHYGADLLRLPLASSGYFVALTDSTGKTGGAVAMPAQTAIAWVERLLGGSPQGPVDTRPLSPLEATLLLDLVAAMTRAFAAASKQAGGPEFRHAETVSPDPAPLAGRETEEFCRFTFAADSGAGRNEVHFFLSSDLAAAIVGSKEARKTSGAEADPKKAILQHLEGVPVTATVRLGSAIVAMRDVATLEPGDVLLLGRRLDEPVELLVGTNVVQYGRPVTFEGRYAVQVLDRRYWPEPSREQPNRKSDAAATP